MRNVHLLHGCARAWRAGAQSMRNYVAEERLRLYLEARPEKYGLPTDESAADVLTVDDATVGGGRACSLAREAGHQVTLFVNPAQVERRRSYWFSRLDALLDASTQSAVTFRGRAFDLRQASVLREFRLAVKAILMMRDEADTEALLEELAVLLGAPDGDIPEHAQTLTLDSLRALVSQGVHIGSHGWDHRDIAGRAPEELARDLRQTAAWCRRSLGGMPRDYAVPYGLSRLPQPAAQEVPGMIYLVNAKLPPGAQGERHWNRREITADLRDPGK